jgi:hypothetical protein
MAEADAESFGDNFTLRRRELCDWRTACCWSTTLKFVRLAHSCELGRGKRKRDCEASTRNRASHYAGSASARVEAMSNYDDLVLTMGGDMGQLPRSTQAERSLQQVSAAAEVQPGRGTVPRVNGRIGFRARRATGARWAGLSIDPHGSGAGQGEMPA